MANEKREPTTGEAPQKSYALADHLRDPLDLWAERVVKRIAELERRVAELEALAGKAP